jgi:hypothetical protein
MSGTDFFSTTEAGAAPPDAGHAFGPGEMDVFSNRSVVRMFINFTFIRNSYAI